MLSETIGISRCLHGPNFAVVPKIAMNRLEYITAIEKSCNQLQQGKAEELRAEIKAIL